MKKFVFGKTSRHHLNQVHPDLKAVAELALSWGIIDFTVYESIRTKGEQNRIYHNGGSKLQWPDSKHNILAPGDLAMAFDAAAFIDGKISWNVDHCIFLAGILAAAASQLKVKMRWGGNWDMDGEPITDQKFQDLVHYEKRG